MTSTEKMSILKRCDACNAIYPEEKTSCEYCGEPSLVTLTEFIGVLLHKQPSGMMRIHDDVFKLLEKFAGKKVRLTVEETI